ncbi:hypothetical protein L596_029624 [Steinernema carpocapsae]|uniref:Uncharacterized protein n=1 Tax=Steinernema carpocapsae TaxID=34508 RepID=A0A4U5LV68_STECR|nr:hypothetical protein L596_029624 [Steinernema carpocapsae]
MRSVRLIFGRSPKWPTLMSEGKTPSFKYTIDIDTYLELLKENLSTLSQIALENADCMRAENKANYDIRNKRLFVGILSQEKTFSCDDHTTKSCAHGSHTMSDLDYSDDDYWTEEWRRRREDREKRETAAAEEDEEPKNIPDKEMAQQYLFGVPRTFRSRPAARRSPRTKPRSTSLWPMCQL